MPDTFSRLLVHIVFSTKDRRPLITPEIREELYPYFGGILIRQRGVLLAAGGMPDHVHLLAGLPPVLSVAKALQLLKANSSKWIHEEKIQDGSFAWQVGYGAFSVSESQIAPVRAYIQRQEEHHRRFSFQDELVRLLQKHSIQIDERSLPDAET